MGESKAPSSPGLPQAAGLLPTTPGAAGPAAKLVEKPPDEGRGPEACSWVCGLGAGEGAGWKQDWLVGLGLFPFPGVIFGLKREGSQVTA